jgi:hypothetical protein
MLYCQHYRDDVLEFKPLIYDDDLNNTDEVVCHYLDVLYDFYNFNDLGCLVYTLLLLLSVVYDELTDICLWYEPEHEV